jgi:hypothetical protein
MADISLDAELRAMQDIATILHRLDQPARARVLHWIADRFQADAAATTNGGAIPQAANGATLPAETDDSLSVAMLGDLFESEWSERTQPSNQTGTEQVRGVAAEGPIWPTLPKPILT